MKQSQADLYLETYQVLDLEMSRLREIQRWQGSAASKVWLLISFIFSIFKLLRSHNCHKDMIFYLQLAADMQRFSRPERRINGPTITHLWCVVSFFVCHKLWWDNYLYGWKLPGNANILAICVLVCTFWIKRVNLTIQSYHENFPKRSYMIS